MVKETKTVMSTATSQRLSQPEILRKRIPFWHLRTCKIMRTARLQKTTMTPPATVPNKNHSDLKLLAKRPARCLKMYQRSWLRAITAPLPTMNKKGSMSGTRWMTSPKGAKRQTES